jgi:hypothetical protein
MDKGLTVHPKISADKSAENTSIQMPQNLSAQIICPSPKVWDFDEKMLLWASVVITFGHHLPLN